MQQAQVGVCLHRTAVGTLGAAPTPLRAEEGPMTTAEDKLAQYLNEAHAMELALARTLQAHSSATSGPPRSRATCAPTRSAC